MARLRSQADDDDAPFRPTRRFKKRRVPDRTPFKPGWFELVLDLLRAYASRTGHALVPRKHREGNFDLGRMVSYLRECQVAGTISAERVRILERLPGWSWGPREDRFQHGLRSLRRFARREGHTFVPPSCEESGFDLGEWVARRRGQHAEGSLSPGHIRALEGVPGWVWMVRDGRQATALRMLREFAAREGHLRVPGGYRVSGFDLRAWLNYQRRKHRQGTLDPGLGRALVRIPHWSWEPMEDRFRQGLQRLRRFATREGHSLVPERYAVAGFKLGRWIRELRKQYARGTLPAERVRLLERLPAWTWSVREWSLRRGLELIRRFVAREGHARVPDRHREASFPLGTWVVMRRRQYKKGTLPLKLVRRLGKLPGWTWDLQQLRFERGLERLRRFVAREGHARVPTAHREESFQLGRWVETRRAEYTARTLPPHHVRALASLPGWSWKIRTRWAARLAVRWTRRRR